MFSTGRLSSEVPYPFIYHLSRKRYPFRAESPRKGHYRESPGMGTHRHTRHSYVNSSIIKMQYFYNRLICKKAAFLQKYIFVKKQYFYNRSMNDFPVIGHLVMRTGLWDRQGANIASRFKGLYGVELYLL